jgi:hypothetical protein
MSETKAEQVAILRELAKDEAWNVANELALGYADEATFHRRQADALKAGAAALMSDKPRLIADYENEIARLAKENVALRAKVAAVTQFIYQVRSDDPLQVTRAGQWVAYLPDPSRYHDTREEANREIWRCFGVTPAPERKDES